MTRAVRSRSRRKVTLVGTLPSNVSLVGAGAVGSALGLLLFEKGYTIASIINRTPKRALALARLVHCKKVSTSVADIAPETEVLIFAVADDALPEVVRQTAKRMRLSKGSNKPLVLHTSGVHSIDILKPVQLRGAMVASFHPIQSFPPSKTARELAKNVEGIHFGVEGEGRALDNVLQLVRLLGGKAVVIPRDMKPLYHTMCVFASNYIITLLNAVAEAAQPLGFDHLWKEMILPLFTTTVENVMKSSPVHALSGPVARNDVLAVMKHLAVLQKFAPHLLPLYTVLSIETARVARQSGRLTSGQFKDFVASIRKQVKQYLSRDAHPSRGKKEKH